MEEALLLAFFLVLVHPAASLLQSTKCTSFSPDAVQRMHTPKVGLLRVRVRNQKIGLVEYFTIDASLIDEMLDGQRHFQMLCSECTHQK